MVYLKVFDDSNFAFQLPIRTFNNTMQSHLILIRVFVSSRGIFVGFLIIYISFLLVKND